MRGAVIGRCQLALFYAFTILTRNPPNVTEEMGGGIPVRVVPHAADIDGYPREAMQVHDDSGDLGIVERWA